jgi:MFS family permease
MQPSTDHRNAGAPQDRPRLYPPSLAVPRRTLTPRIGCAVAALVVGLCLFASVTPSPLYRTYSVLWHFSPLTLTLIYATYAFGVLASLLLAGGVSDDVRRRPVLLVALAALIASSVVFMVADSAAWLFIARGLQGLATGAALSAASAALLDLHPKRDPAGVGLRPRPPPQAASVSARSQVRRSLRSC